MKFTISERLEGLEGMKSENVCALALALALDLYKSVKSKGHPLLLYITLIEKKDGRFYICKTKSGGVRNYKIWIRILILINMNVNFKIIRVFRDLKK